MDKNNLKNGLEAIYTSYMDSPTVHCIGDDQEALTKMKNETTDLLSRLEPTDKELFSSIRKDNLLYKGMATAAIVVSFPIVNKLFGIELNQYVVLAEAAIGLHAGIALFRGAIQFNNYVSAAEDLYLERNC